MRFVSCQLSQLEQNTVTTAIDDVDELAELEF